jgi:hypothetical protein
VLRRDELGYLLFWLSSVALFTIPDFSLLGVASLLSLSIRIVAKLKTPTHTQRGTYGGWLGSFR